MAAPVFYLAPLRGVTDRIFRRVYERHFGRFDFMLAPFVPTVRGRRVRDCHIADLLPDDSGGADGRLIPQIIGSDAAGFLLLSRRFADMGFGSVNWNLGCPAPRIARKSRGCGLLPHRDAIERFLDAVAPALPIPLSIKTRLGLDDAGDLEKLLPLFNAYPLKEVMIHPRTGSQLYGGSVDLVGFGACLRASGHPVVYSGDIRSAADFRVLSARFPGVGGWMVGRGVLAYPRLLGELRGAASVGSPRAFLDDLLEANLNAVSPLKALGKMKELWGYLGDGIDGSGALRAAVERCGSVGEYRAVVARGAF